CCSDLVHRLAAQVIIEKCRVERRALDDAHGVLDRARLSMNLGPGVLQARDDLKGNERLVLHHQEAPSRPAGKPLNNGTGVARLRTAEVGRWQLWLGCSLHCGAG